MNEPGSPESNITQDSEIQSNIKDVKGLLSQEVSRDGVKIGVDMQDKSLEYLLQMEITQLAKHCRQLQIDKDKLKTLQRTNQTNYSKEIHQLRSQLAKIKNDYEKEHQMVADKERQLQATLSQCYLLREDNGRHIRVITQLEKDLTNRKCSNCGTMGGNPTSNHKSVEKQLSSLTMELSSSRGVIDVLRQELHREKINRTREKLSNQHIIQELETKCAYLDQMNEELKVQLDLELSNKQSIDKACEIYVEDLNNTNQSLAQSEFQAIRSSYDGLLQTHRLNQAVRDRDNISQSYERILETRSQQLSQVYASIQCLKEDIDKLIDQGRSQASLDVVSSSLLPRERTKKSKPILEEGMTIDEFLSEVERIGQSLTNLLDSIHLDNDQKNNLNQESLVKVDMVTEENESMKLSAILPIQSNPSTSSSSSTSSRMIVNNQENTESHDIDSNKVKQAVVKESDQRVTELEDQVIRMQQEYVEETQRTTQQVEMMMRRLQSLQLENQQLNQQISDMQTLSQSMNPIETVTTCDIPINESMNDSIDDKTIKVSVDEISIQCNLQTSIDIDKLTNNLECLQQEHVNLRSQYDSMIQSQREIQIRQLKTLEYYDRLITGNINELDQDDVTACTSETPSNNPLPDIYKLHRIIGRLIDETIQSADIINDHRLENYDDIITISTSTTIKSSIFESKEQRLVMISKRTWKEFLSLLQSSIEQTVDEIQDLKESTRKLIQIENDRKTNQLQTELSIYQTQVQSLKSQLRDALMNNELDRITIQTLQQDLNYQKSLLNDIEYNDKRNDEDQTVSEKMSHTSSVDSFPSSKSLSIPSTPPFISFENQFKPSSTIQSKPNQSQSLSNEMINTSNSSIRTPDKSIDGKMSKEDPTDFRKRLQWFDAQLNDRQSLILSLQKENHKLSTTMTQLTNEYDMKNKQFIEMIDKMQLENKQKIESIESQLKGTIDNLSNQLHQSQNLLEKNDQTIHQQSIEIKDSRNKLQEYQMLMNEFIDLNKNLEVKYHIETIKNQELIKQINSVPGSLSIAHAENRVWQTKLDKVIQASELNCIQIKQELERNIEELKNFNRLLEQEKEHLKKKLEQQSLTIHQLTHHLHVLHSQQALQTHDQYQTLFNSDSLQLDLQNKEIQQEYKRMKESLPISPWANNAIPRSSNKKTMSVERHGLSSSAKTDLDEETDLSYGNDRSVLIDLNQTIMRSPETPNTWKSPLHRMKPNPSVMLTSAQKNRGTKANDQMDSMLTKARLTSFIPSIERGARSTMKTQGESTEH